MKISIWCHFSCTQTITYNIYFIADLLVINWFSICLTEKEFTSPPFLKGIFLSIVFYVNHFLTQFLKESTLLFFTSIISKGEFWFCSSMHYDYLIQFLLRFSLYYTFSEIWFLHFFCFVFFAFFIILQNLRNFWQLFLKYSSASLFPSEATIIYALDHLFLYHKLLMLWYFF